MHILPEGSDAHKSLRVVPAKAANVTLVVPAQAWTRDFTQ